MSCFSVATSRAKIASKLSLDEAKFALVQLGAGRVVVQGALTYGAQFSGEFAGHTAVYDPVLEELTVTGYAARRLQARFAEVARQYTVAKAILALKAGGARVLDNVVTGTATVLTIEI